jgi:hypothetical protein
MWGFYSAQSAILLFAFQNFSLVYIKLGFHRLPGPKQAELLPELVSALSGKGAQQQDRYGGRGRGSEGWREGE